MTTLSKFCGLFLISCLTLSAWAQANSVPAAARGAAPATNVHTTDDPDVLRETQQGIGSNGYSGLVWWIPFEFWGRSAAKSGGSAEKVRETFKALRDYTVVGVMVAKVSALGSFEYVTPADLQKKIFIRDASGNDYPALVNVSGDAQNVADMMRPILGNAMGRAGQNFAMMFFPGHDRNGNQIADALSKGQFSVVVKDALGEPETIYAWRTPLDSFKQPRYCPIGKERVHANWDYCPWHGAKLADTP